MDSNFFEREKEMSHISDYQSMILFFKWAFRVFLQGFELLKLNSQGNYPPWKKGVETTGSSNTTENTRVTLKKLPPTERKKKKKFVKKTPLKNINI